jgi:phosphoribosylaminoimidazolecarboxamide formyltransferase/IMP cyclohydrolase
VDEDTARELIEVNKVFAEIVLAPAYTDRALDVLTSKPDLRVLELSDMSKKSREGELDIKKVDGGVLIQDADSTLYDDARLKVVTNARPTEKELEDMAFAMKVVKHVKSNAIVIAYDKRTLGIGPGQTNRISSVEIAIRGLGPALDGGDAGGLVLASDAFFPFDDCVAMASEAGVRAIIQPGGSIRDEDSIRMANEKGLVMVFTGERHFKH